MSFHTIVTWQRMSSMKHFGIQLRQAFERTGASSFNIALDLGIDPSVMSKVLHGKRNPPKGFIDKITDSNVLDVSKDEMAAWLILDEYTAEQIAIANSLLNSQGQQAK